MVRGSSVAKQASQRTLRQPPPQKGLSWLAAVGIAASALVIGAVLFVVAASPETVGGTTAWSRLGTQDIHSLAFDPDDENRLYFGHHGGLLESTDGGRTWQGGTLRGADAMNVRPTSEDIFQIAGHDLYLESTDGGESWQPVPNDLPSLDLHAFTVDPSDADRAWAYAVGAGLFETTDRGRRWELRQPGNWPLLASHAGADGSVLLGVSEAGLRQSTDGGRTWTLLTAPGGQVTSLAATADGTIYAGTSQGLKRSSDAGETWNPTAFSGVALTIAVSPADPSTVALVDDQTRFFRSPDRGATWRGP